MVSPWLDGGSGVVRERDDAGRRRERGVSKTDRGERGQGLTSSPDERKKISALKGDILRDAGAPRRNLPL